MKLFKLLTDGQDKMIQLYTSRNLYTRVILVAYPETEALSKKYE